MREIDLKAAGNRLPELLAAVERGARFVITRRGRPVAQLSPIAERDEQRMRRAISDLHSLRDGLRRRGVRMSDLLREGETIRDLAHERAPTQEEPKET